MGLIGSTCKPYLELLELLFARAAVGRFTGGANAGACGSQLLDEAAQVEFESTSSKRFIKIRFQGLRSRRFQCGFDTVNLHRPTLIVPSSVVESFANFLVLSCARSNWQGLTHVPVSAHPELFYPPYNPT